jgi:hypothetical protein
MVIQVAEVIRKMVRQWFPTEGQLVCIELGAKSRLGKVVMTPKAQATLGSREVVEALLRHARGDDGDLDEFYTREPERRALDGCRRLSVFRTTVGGRFWVITEADATLTTVLLPEDF